MMQDRLSEKMLLISGATSGVGRAIAENFCKKYSLILGGRNKEKLEYIKKLCEKKGGKEIILWNEDLSELDLIYESVKKLVTDNDVEVGKFIHCAGVSQVAPLRMLDAKQYNYCFAVNTISAALIVKALINRRVNKQNLDSVVFVSSNISNRGAKAFSAYGASKAALDGLMRNLAVELAPHVRINSVLPGGMKTSMTEKFFQDESLITKMTKSSPLGIGKPEDLISIIDLLISDSAAWITGQQFTVDGGRTINITE